MNECAFIYRTYHIVSWRFTILIERDRTSACEGASGSRYQFIFDLTHPRNPCMECRIDTTTPGTTCAALFDKCVGSITSSVNHLTLKMRKTGPRVYSPYPRMHICTYVFLLGHFCTCKMTTWKVGSHWVLNSPSGIALFA